jgi:hypothetical protein
VFRKSLQGEVSRQHDGLSARRTIVQSWSTSRTDIVTVSTQADRCFHAFETYWALQKVG